MIGYTMLGTNDLDRAAAFYDALLGEIGARRVMTNDRTVMFGNAPGAAMLAICKPFDEGEAGVGNGTMVALAMESPEAVDRLHARALELGGTTEGDPGPRGDGGFYGGYFRDLDGNKLCGFCMQGIGS